MKNKFSDEEVQKIDELNNKLIAIEEEIYILAEVEYKRTKQKLQENAYKGMFDHELELELLFYTTQEEDEYGDPKEIFTWDYECIHFKSFEEGEPFGINDKQCHNVTSSLIDNKSLNRQKHCWLLHRLYDDFNVSWENILLIDGMYFDIKVSYQYEKKV